jgi:tetratricopeptide (TPR) repeat protein
MKKILFNLCLVLLASLGYSQENLKTVFGTVSDDFGVLKDVDISIPGKDQGVVSDAAGKYTIQAQEGDVLVFSHMGMMSQEIPVEDVTRVLNITMYPKVEQLKNVTVTQNMLKNQQELAIAYKSNPKIIRTAFGYWDGDATSFQLRTIDKKEINTGAMDIATVIQSRFPAIKIQRNLLETQVFLRIVGSLNSSPAGYDIDGLLTKQFPSYLDPQNIERIGLVTSFSALTRYGTFGAGGIIVINTKTANFQPKDENGQIIDMARRKDNIYTTTVLGEDTQKQNQPDYLQQWYAANSEAQAKGMYNDLASKYIGSYIYFLDAYDYFVSQWKDQTFADSIITDNWAQFADNPVALKSLAFLYQAQGELEKANTLYKEVFILRPNYAQSYLDLADSYREIGDYQKAAGIYARYGYLSEEGFLNDTQKVFTQMIDRELNNLIALKGRDLLSKRDLKKLTLDEYFEGTRLVFEWADSEAEFELQFVNPQNRYFEWKHSLRDNADRIKDEKSIGYATEEYLIDDALKGNWQVNINYLGNKSLTPTYLKATIYHNYGSPGQSKETKVFKLSLKNVTQRLFSVNNGDGVVSR